MKKLRSSNSVSLGVGACALVGLRAHTGLHSSNKLEDRRQRGKEKNNL